MYNLLARKYKWSQYSRKQGIFYKQKTEKKSHKLPADGHFFRRYTIFAIQTVDCTGLCALDSPHFHIASETRVALLRAFTECLSREIAKNKLGYTKFDTAICRNNTYSVFFSSCNSLTPH